MLGSCADFTKCLCLPDYNPLDYNFILLDTSKSLADRKDLRARNCVGKIK